jgi:small-conductance mechanosensitive channel
MKQFVDYYLSTFNSAIAKALIVFLAYIILAKVADFLTDKIIRRITKFTKSEFDDYIIDLIHRPVFFTVIILGGIHSITILNASVKFVFYSTGILFSFLAVLWAICIIKVSKRLIAHSIHKVSDITGLSNELTPLIENIWIVLVLIGSTMFIFSVWEINITPLLASAGVVGVAVALAAKDTLANFFGGISIFIDRPYKIGDYIVLDGGERGEVRQEMIYL